MATDEQLRALGRRLQSRREAAGLTQPELGQRCGLSESYISRLERGYGGAKAADLLRLAVALGTTASDLLGEQPALLAQHAAERTVTDPTLLDVFARLQAGLSDLEPSRRARLLVLLRALADLHAPPLPATVRPTPVGVEWD